MDYSNPDYTAVYADRQRRLAWLQSDKERVAAARIYYSTHHVEFITDWGVTFDPRNIERGLITSIPFILWDRQREYVEWVVQQWRAQERGLVEKSRDCGVTWLSVGIAVSHFLFVDGFVTGFGSRKEELVDRRGDDKSIFEKVRFFIDHVPKVFMPVGFNEHKHSAHMRVVNPATNAAIIGEAGSDIGRGGRTSIYFVDEAAFVEQQGSVDAALSQTTNCQIDISTPNGPGNVFARKKDRFKGTSRVFIFDWRNDPRKDDAWYQKQVDEQDEVTVAQEIDRNYNASVEDSFIDAKWVTASIDAHLRLGFTPSGIRAVGFDPADIGDGKAVAFRWGSVVMECDQKTKGDITDALPWAFDLADHTRSQVLRYDADGMGAPTLKTYMLTHAARRFKVMPYNGSSSVEDPAKPYGGAYRMVEDLSLRDDAAENLRSNTDTFLNYRAQTWTWLRDRFEATYHAVQRANQGQIINVDPDNLISLSSKMKCIFELQAELSTAKRLFTPNGKIKVESKVQMRNRGISSPNLADSLVIAMSVRTAVALAKPVTMKRYRTADRRLGM